MTIARLRQKITLMTATVATALIGTSGVASAHVAVKPAEVLTAGFQTFVMGVPNEKDQPTTSLKLLIPQGLAHVSPTQKAGWNIIVEKEGNGEDMAVKSITWGGGSIDVGMRDDFTFSAQVPDKTTELPWKAYQTYADGTVVSWDKAGNENHDDDASNSGPFSVTKVVSETSQDGELRKAEQAVADAKKRANQAFVFAISGLAVGLAGFSLASRKR
jgi:uncharacterized protein YcnI